jgi:hypothetical protein
MPGNENKLLKILEICREAKKSNLGYNFNILYNKIYYNLKNNKNFEEILGTIDHDYIKFIDIEDTKEFDSALQRSFLALLPFETDYYNYNLSDAYKAFQYSCRMIFNPHNSLDEFYNLNKVYKLSHLKLMNLTSDEEIIKQVNEFLKIYRLNSNLYLDDLVELGVTKNYLNPLTISEEWFNYFNYKLNKIKNVDVINTEATFNKFFNRRIVNYDRWSIIEDDINIHHIP